MHALKNVQVLSINAIRFQRCGTQTNIVSVTAVRGTEFAGFASVRALGKMAAPSLERNQGFYWHPLSVVLFPSVAFKILCIFEKLYHAFCTSPPAVSSTLMIFNGLARFHSKCAVSGPNLKWVGHPCCTYWIRLWYEERYPDQAQQCKLSPWTLRQRERKAPNLNDKGISNHNMTLGHQT